MAKHTQTIRRQIVFGHPQTFISVRTTAVNQTLLGQTQAKP